MNAKSLLTIGLLLFVAMAAITIVVREARDKPSSDEPATAVVASSLPTDGLVAYYFHGETRCPTCRHIEDYALVAFETGFADELARGDVAWRVVNYETPANSHFAIDYELVAPTVVLVRTFDGTQTEWRNLARVWELVGDKDAFVEYVQEAAAEMLAATRG